MNAKRCPKLKKLPKPPQGKSGWPWTEESPQLPDGNSSASEIPPPPPIDTYAPIHEQEIRRRLQNDARKPTPEQGPHCGVHDRTPDRRDTGNRTQLRAEIDVYVADLYGLSRNDLTYLLDTFPVPKKNEEEVFGEFMSKSKCLELFFDSEMRFLVPLVF